MARSTPAAHRWPSQTVDEERPLLAADAETRSPVAKLPARAVISKKKHQNSFHVDHGWLPWLQVIAGWVLFTNSWGLPSAYGTFQTHYTQDLLSEYSAATITWIGSVQVFMSTFGCLPAGLLLDQGYLQGLIAVGSVLEILLSQGVFTDMGYSLLGLLPVAVISMYFEEKRTLAAAIASTGASFAGIAQLLILKYLFETIGFPWVIRMLALAVLLSSAFPFFVMRLQSEGAEGRSRFSLNYFKDLTYSTFVCTFTLIQAAAMVPNFFIQEYALSLGIDETMAFHLLAVLNLAGLFGRFIPNFIADRQIGGINTLLPLALAYIILLFTLPWFRTLSSLVVFCVLAADLGVRMGLAYLFAAFGGLVGNPLSGSAKDAGNASAVSEFQGVCFMLKGHVEMEVCL
ncbi:MFS general substrate transporter [Bimuria novae-zelandiae CBS 107.79]|uniref:MFS general substrate transporter n=1 Tax=Bimuria novae-zelandiae CBS 107.79 TaxID=1447943 RepID=A0A6A5V1W4_9PLEO|nr:MFS general substrate transporter [Bimuria novae-zelandiae CBS 107.79]